ncbi:hypothetical protein [Phaeobacter sp. HF9A]|uniref:hypothetical protein n=1 Tax=Phaeobacter sp. HF9A TaxID=2721561 RepID=UPI00142F67FA|nr:hypothetical protein [Phaeobacter sp. HF9A]NIZ12669.1 hypothetical protein [Phaeobacter sp. HF9A]
MQEFAVIAALLWMNHSAVLTLESVKTVNTNLLRKILNLTLTLWVNLRDIVGAAGESH